MLSFGDIILANPTFVGAHLLTNTEDVKASKLMMFRLDSTPHHINPPPYPKTQQKEKKALHFKLLR